MHDYMVLMALALAISVGLSLLFRRVGLPLLVGYVLAGMVVSGLFGFRYDQNDLLRGVAELGVVFLLFTVGLEFSVQRFHQMRREVLLIGGGQVALTTAIFTAGGSMLFNLPFTIALIIGMSLSLSSTAIVLKTLYENRDIGKPYGNTALGILLFQEISVVPMLLLVGFLAQEGEISLWWLFLETAVGATIAFAVIYFSGRHLVSRLLAGVGDMRSREAFVALVLLMVISAALLTHSLGFSYSLGAFLAGLILAETKYRYQVEADLVPFRDLLLGVFFITVGMQIDLQFTWEYLWWILFATLVLMGLKTVLAFTVVRLAGTREVALKTSLAIAQGGGFSFAVLELALRLELLSPQLHQMVVVTLVFSMLAAPFVLKAIHNDGGWLARDPGADAGRPLIKPIEQPASAASHSLTICHGDSCQQVALDAHTIVVCGYGPMGQSVVAKLRQAGFSYVCIEHQQALVDEGVARGDIVMFGNAAQQEILVRAGVQDAWSVIITVEDEKSKRMIGKAVASISETPLLVTFTTHPEELALWQELPVKGMVDQPLETAQLLVSRALRRAAQPHGVSRREAASAKGGETVVDKKSAASTGAE
uniref:Putative Kef-type potassium-efflux system protein n=1 Tax=Magnetococcus massalia (strain MO-1) TaxID=451514 RepID=A0A1S7LH99_MAGMO|nr:Putative Kef-type potassium-efflux system protein [Candidatus Magnetococcus massalia]